MAAQRPVRLPCGNPGERVAARPVRGAGGGHGVAKTATLDGHELTNRRTLGTWAVPGMFNTIQIDVENQARKDRGELLLRAEFDPQLGIPRRYERVEMRQLRPRRADLGSTRFSGVRAGAEPERCPRAHGNALP